MFERDYFMRMIGQMAQVMGQMMGLRKEHKQEEALLIIDDLFNQQFRLNAKLIRSLSDADLVRIMTTNGVVETANLHAIALLMKEEAEILDELGRPDQSYVSRLKAFHLFIRLSLLDSSSLLRTPSEEAADLAAQLNVYELPQRPSCWCLNGMKRKDAMTRLRMYYMNCWRMGQSLGRKRMIFIVECCFFQMSG